MSLGTGRDRDEALRRAVCITAGVIVAKQLVAAPANVLTPGACALHTLSIVSNILPQSQCNADKFCCCGIL